MTFLLLAGALIALDVQRPTRRHAPVLIFAVAGAVLAAVFLVGRATILLAGLASAGTIAWTVRDLLAQRASRARAAAEAAYLGTLAADLRAGASLPHALSAAAQRLPDTVSETLRAELTVVALVASRGGRVSAALHSAGLGQLAALIALAEAHGLPLAGLVEQAQSRLDSARRHAQATSAALQGPQSTAIVLTCLPLAGLGMGSAMGADPLGLLLGGGLGGLLLVVGTSLVCGGFVWSRIILRRAAAC